MFQSIRYPNYFELYTLYSSDIFDLKNKFKRIVEWSEMERTCCCNLTVIETALFVFEKESFCYVPPSFLQS